MRGPRRLMMVEDLPEPMTIPALLRRGVDRWGDDVLLVHDGRRRTWKDVEQESAEIAKGLLALGATKGSRVGLLMPNTSDWVVAFLAAARIGATLSLLSTFQQAPELSRSLAIGDVQILLCVDKFLKHDYLQRLEQIPGVQGHRSRELLLPTHPYLRHIVSWGASGRPWAVEGRRGLLEEAVAKPGIDDRLLSAVEATVSPADWLLTIWTSGTTAEPKGVVHDHGTVIRYCHSLRSMGRADLRRCEPSYSAMPFFWLGGLNSQLIPALMCGAVIVTTDHHEPEDVLRVLLDSNVRRVSGWLRPLVELQQAAASNRIDISQIRGLAPIYDATGSIVPPERQSNALGMTETFGPYAAEAPGRILPADKAGGMGRVVGDYEWQIVVPDSRTAVANGAVGELLVRGPNLMVGYYKQERCTTFEPDGFFRTGDRCSVDAEGFLYWHGRSGDMIKTSGANVSPAEIEAILRSRAEVGEAIVFGIPDAERNEAIVAVLVPSGPTAIDTDAIQHWLGTEMAHYKVPHHFKVAAADQIPRTESGKVRKYVLAREVERDLLSQLG